MPFVWFSLQRRKLDAVYYYMRSLAASNPILTAKESLTSLFEETKRKVWGAQVRSAFISAPPVRSSWPLSPLFPAQAEQLEQKSPGQRSRSKKAAFRPSGDDATRLELWIHPSHPRSSQGQESSRDSEQDSGLSSLSPSDVSTGGGSSAVFHAATRWRRSAGYAESLLLLPLEGGGPVGGEGRFCSSSIRTWWWPFQASPALVPRCCSCRQKATWVLALPAQSLAWFCLRR